MCFLRPRTTLGNCHVASPISHPVSLVKKLRSCGQCSQSLSVGVDSISSMIKNISKDVLLSFSTMFIDSSRFPRDDFLRHGFNLSPCNDRWWNPWKNKTKWRIRQGQHPGILRASITPSQHLSLKWSRTSAWSIACKLSKSTNRSVRSVNVKNVKNVKCIPRHQWFRWQKATRAALRPLRRSRPPPPPRPPRPQHRHRRHRRPRRPRPLSPQWSPWAPHLATLGFSQSIISIIN